MRSKAAFTLVEMLAVIGIMLVLMAVTFGMFGTFAEQSGPEATLATVQAVLNNARDYAASNGVSARIKFEVDDDSRTVQPGTTIRLQYYEVGTNNWENVPGRIPYELGNNLYVLKGIPDVGSLAGALPNTDARNPSPEDIRKWRDYQASVLRQVESYAVSGSKIKAEHKEFYLEFGPAGYPPADPKTNGSVAENGLTVVKVVGGTVAGFAFYPLNTNTGTRLVFD